MDVETGQFCVSCRSRMRLPRLVSVYGSKGRWMLVRVAVVVRTVEYRRRAFHSKTRPGHCRVGA